MSENKKRFWWLKLKEGYFNSEGMRRLRKQAGGEVFTIIYLKMQLASLETCTLPSKKPALYCTRDPARISRTIICRNNIDTDPPYWVLFVLRRVEGRFR